MPTTTDRCTVTDEARNCIVKAFGEKAQVREPDDCWPWTAAVDSSGIGRLRVGGQNFTAPRFAYQIAFGPIPNGERLGHLCRNSGCVNPAHMRFRSSREMNEVRFWEQVDKSGECWVWTGSEYGKGYGQMYVNGRKLLAHRVSFEWHFGVIPEGTEVDHICWNRRCVRPDHLRLATASENQRNKSGATARSSTGVRGVTLRPNGRYQARVRSKGETIWTAHFATLEEAAGAISEKRRQLWGEFAGADDLTLPEAFAAALKLVVDREVEPPTEAGPE